MIQTHIYIQIQHVDIIQTKMYMQILKVVPYNIYIYIQVWQIIVGVHFGLLEYDCQTGCMVQIGQETV